jgi:hydrogenase nickel incorporation protein HypA/HybF
MHELSIAQSIISTVEHSLPEGFSKNVLSVQLSIGKLSGIEIDALKFAFDIIKKESLLKVAELDIEAIKGIARCNDCSNQIEMNEFGIPCPSCGGFSFEIVQGKEMKVTSVEIED